MSDTLSRMPALFVGHGSPMNALDANRYTQAWQELARQMPRPTAILVISAHWQTRVTAVTAMAMPRTIHDFGGFPQALFDQRYPAPGDRALALRIREQLAPLPVELDTGWGLDHGAWSVLIKMYPKADIPVLQLSLATNQPPEWHAAVGQGLAALRDQGVLLLGTGNVVHNLGKLVWGTAPAAEWATRFNQRMRDTLTGAQPESVARFASWGPDAALAVPSDEHFLPLLYILGSRAPAEPLSIPVDGIELGTISMMSVMVGEMAVKRADGVHGNAVSSPT